jgi:curved DNA-binding protein CbpA
MDALARLDYFAVLGVARDAPASAVRAAYLRRSREFHPDARPHALPFARACYASAFIVAREAYAVLADDALRAAYAGAASHAEGVSRSRALQWARREQEPEPVQAEPAEPEPVLAEPAEPEPPVDVDEVVTDADAVEQRTENASVAAGVGAERVTDAQPQPGAPSDSGQEARRGSRPRPALPRASVRLMLRARRASRARRTRARRI